MDGLKTSLLNASDMFYVGEYDQGVSALMQIVGELGLVNGLAEWVNPLFDALDRRDFLCAADIIRAKITPLIG